MLAIFLKPGGFFEVQTDRGEVIRVHVVDATASGVSLGVEAPLEFDIARDKVLAKRAAMRQPRFGPGYEALEANHLKD